jgi:hypothetical protein
MVKILTILFIPIFVICVGLLFLAAVKSRLILNLGWDFTLIANILIAIGTIGSILIILFKESILAYTRRPQLILDVKRLFYLQKQNSAQGQLYYYRLGIENIGKTRAEGCVICLEELSKKEDNIWKKIDSFMPLPIHFVWTNTENWIENYVEHGQAKYFDLARIRKTTLNTLESGYFPLEFCIWPISEDITLRFIKVGTYKLKLTIYSKNSEAKTYQLIIIWSGKWEEETGEMKLHIHEEMKCINKREKFFDKIYKNVAE